MVLKPMKLAMLLVLNILLLLENPLLLVTDPLMKVLDLLLMITLAIIILVPFKMVLPELPYLLVKQFFPLMGVMIMWIVEMGVV